MVKILIGKGKTHDVNLAFISLSGRGLELQIQDGNPKSRKASRDAFAHIYAAVEACKQLQKKPVYKQAERLLRSVGIQKNADSIKGSYHYVKKRYDLNGILLQQYAEKLKS